MCVDRRTVPDEHDHHTKVWAITPGYDATQIVHSVVVGLERLGQDVTPAEPPRAGRRWSAPPKHGVSHGTEPSWPSPAYCHYCNRRLGDSRTDRDLPDYCAGCVALGRGEGDTGAPAEPLTREQAEYQEWASLHLAIRVLYGTTMWTGPKGLPQ